MKKFFKIAGIILLSIFIIGIGIFGYARYKLNNIVDTKNLQDLVDKNSEKLINDKKVIGFSLGLIKNNEIYIASYGFANLESKIKVDSTTIFEIGSISKIFTTEIAQILVERNVISWQDDIIKYYPKEFIPKMNDKTKLLHLATHTSGFESIPKFFENKMSESDCNPYQKLNINHLYQYIKNPIGKTKPDITKSEYSNLGNGLLGHILEWRTNNSYEDLLQNEICNKLNMKNTSLKVRDFKKFATGYDDYRKETCYWELPILYSAGAIRSNITDMVKFTKANLNNSCLNKTFKETQKKVYKTSGGGIGKGWQIDSETNLITGVGEITWHNGGTGGFSSYVGMVPDKNIGIVLLANQGDVNFEIEILARKILLLAQKVSMEIPTK
jgi:CubicO group peptidase (beta-lactamase class C family)